MAGTASFTTSSTDSNVTDSSTRARTSRQSRSRYCRAPARGAAAHCKQQLHPSFGDDVHVGVGFGEFAAGDPLQHGPHVVVASGQALELHQGDTGSLRAVEGDFAAAVEIL